MTLIKLIIALTLGAPSLLVESIHSTSGATQEEQVKMATKCKGDNVVLWEPKAGVVPRHVFVFRNSQSVASTSVLSTGDLKGRLFVNSDSSVILTNLTFRDLGEYRVDVKTDDERILETTTNLVIGDPPRTSNGMLMVMADSSNDSLVRLKCGALTSLGYPPVSAVWKDPAGQMMASTSFTDQYFTLDLPVTLARPGRYCCQLDCRSPPYCCLDDQSPLRQCVTIDVNKKDTPTTDESMSVKNFMNLVQELDTTHNQGNLQKSVTAVYFQVQGQTACGQRDSPTEKFSREEHDVHKAKEVLHNRRQTMADFQTHIYKDMAILNESLDQQRSFLETVKEALIRHQNETEVWISQLSRELSEWNTSLSFNTRQIIDNIARQDHNMSQTIDNLHTQYRDGMVRVNDHINNQFQKHGDQLESLKTEVAGHQKDTETWMATTRDELKEIKSKLRTVADGLTDPAITTTTTISEIQTEVLGSKGQQGQPTDFFRTKNFTCLEKGYTLHAELCLMLYQNKTNKTEAAGTCEADGGHLVHLKSRAQDLPPFWDLLAKHGKQLNWDSQNGVWVGAEDVTVEGTFVWTDGTVIPKGSDLWLPNQPDDYQTGEDCVEISGNPLEYGFNDYSCSKLLDFVCQIDI